MKTIAFIKSLATAICFVAPLSVSALEVQVDDTFGLYGFSWDRQGEMVIRYRPVVHEDQLYICGAYSNRGGSGATTNLGRQVMREARMKMGDETIARNLTFFNIVSSSNNSTRLVGTTAKCRNTNRTAEGLDVTTVEIQIRNGRYRANR